MGKSTKFIILQFVKIKKIIRRIKMNVRYWQVWILGGVFFDGNTYWAIMTRQKNILQILCYQ